MRGQINMCQNRIAMTRREVLRTLSATLPALRLSGQAKSDPPAPKPLPDSFKVYTDVPRLLLRPQRLKLLRRERERRTLRWDQFETLWTAHAQFPELPWVQALRFQIAGDKDAATRAIAWAVGPADVLYPAEVRQMAIVADWCEPLMNPDDKRQLASKLSRVINDPRPLTNLADARARIFAAVALSETQSAASAKALESAIAGFWNGAFIPSLRSAKATVPNDEAYALLEILHVVRDNLNFDLRETFPAWFNQYPLLHLMAHYPAPFPGPANEFRIPADVKIDQAGPDVRKATLSRAAELAMVAFDANASSSQLLQGWVTNDRFLLRDPFGIPYEFLWANPYQPGLSYYHVPLALHDEIGGQLFIRSSWEEDAAWAGFFDGQLQIFKDGAVTRADPKQARQPLDLDAAIVFFARESKKFELSKQEDSTAVFIVGLDPGRSYHVEIDGEEMIEEKADPGGIVYLTSVPPGGIRLGPAPV
jgi:hypothetical protein